MALENRRWSIVQFLIHHGADLQYRSRVGKNAFDIAWDYILKKSVPTETAEWLSVLFPYSQYDKQYGFLKLHEAVLGIGSTNIEEAISRLALVPQTIDDKDLTGRTAVSWAAARGDMEATEHLLRHGANPNIGGKSWFPLLESVAYGNSKCASLLLQYGADPHAAISSGHNALHFLAYDTSCSMPTVELLYSIHVAFDSNGHSALLMAVQANNHVMVRWLLQHNANYKWYQDGTILHFVASHGSIELVEILLEARLVGIDVHDLEPHWGKKASEILISPDLRPSPATPEMMERFTLLLNEIEERTIAQDYRQSLVVPASVRDENESEEENEFVDTVEEQPSNSTG